MAKAITTIIKPQEYEFDASGKILGRLATEVALLLRGKNSPHFEANNLKASCKVTVYNTDELKFTGNKLEGKEYFWHTGYPGGIKSRTLKEAMKVDSREVFRSAVYGMLPKNRLRSEFIKNLKLLKGGLK